MKARLEFSLPDEAQEFDDARQGSMYRDQLDQVWEQVFRPYLKHGYRDEELNKVIEDNAEVAEKIIEKLSQIYLDIRSED